MVSQEDDFWQVIIEQLQLIQSAEKENKEETACKIGGKGTAETHFFMHKNREK